MNSQELVKLNSLINQAYQCFSFPEFLKLTIMKLHEFVMYDSGMFFCGISRDCSFFKPYIDGKVENYYKKHNFPEKENYLSQGEAGNVGSEAYVYRSTDRLHGMVQIADDPRSSFLASQTDFHIVCVRIINKGQFMGEIYLHRSKDKPDFDDEDLFTLRLLQPHIATVFGIIHTITAVQYLETNNQPTVKKGMCILDRELSLIGGNVTGLEMLRTPTVFGSSILYHLKEQCEDILEHEAAPNSRNTLLKSRLLKTSNGDLSIDIFCKNDQKAGKNAQFVIVMAFCNNEQISADNKFKFTKREAEIIDGLIQGKNNTQLAKALGVSENTIKTHIQSIYRKTGANNRTELTYVLMLNRE